MLPGDADVVIALPLFHSRLPVAPFVRVKNGGRSSSRAVEGKPVASVKTTPLTMIGVAGEERSCETQPGSSDERAARVRQLQRNHGAGGDRPVGGSTARGHTTAAGSRIHDVPALDSCHVARASPLTEAPAPRNGFDARSGVA